MLIKISSLLERPLKSNTVLYLLRGTNNNANIALFTRICEVMHQKQIASSKDYGIKNGGCHFLWINEVCFSEVQVVFTACI